MTCQQDLHKAIYWIGGWHWTLNTKRCFDAIMSLFTLYTAKWFFFFRNVHNLANDASRNLKAK